MARFRRRAEARSLCGASGGTFACAGRDHPSGGIGERTRGEFEPEEALLLDEARHDELFGEAPVEAEPLVIGRVADEQHGVVAAGDRTRQGFANESRAEPEATMAPGDRQRPEQQGRPSGPGLDVPQPQRADEFARILGDEREACSRPAPLAQALAGLRGPRRAEGQVEQSFACGDVRGRLVEDANDRAGLDHAPADHGGRREFIRRKVQSIGHLGLPSGWRDDPRTVCAASRRPSGTGMLREAGNFRSPPLRGFVEAQIT